MKLPLRRILGTHPPQFEYEHKVALLDGGAQIVPCRGSVPAAMEAALCELLQITEKLVAEKEAAERAKVRR